MAEFPQILAKNIFENATVGGAGFTEHPIYKIEYIGDRSRMSKWQGSSVSSIQRIIWSIIGGAQTVDTFVFDRNFDLTGQIPKVTLQYADSAAGPWTAAKKEDGFTDMILSAPDSSRVYWQPLEPLTKGHWSLLLEGLSGMQRPPSIFNVWLGSRIELSFGPYGDFDPSEEEVVGEPVHGAAGGFQWTQRFRRRVLRAGFENLTDSQCELLDRWWSEAAGAGKNWWWLSFPQSAPDDPLYLNCEGSARRFAFVNSVRHGVIEAREVI